jgi:Outer membrane protein beta-barrel domain
MKKIFYVILIAFITTSAIGQEVSNGKKKKKFRKIQLDLFTDIWEGLPADISFRDYNPGVNLYYSYPIPINENFAFSLGGGLSWHNLYSNSVPMSMLDSTNAYCGTQFVKLPSGTTYKKSKLGLTYFDIPMEFRIKTYEPKKFRFAIGGKVGFLVSARNKYKGDALTGDFQNFNKTLKIDNINFIRYGLTARIGYGIFNFYAFYSLSELFEHSASPSMFPISFGISLLKY